MVLLLGQYSVGKTSFIKYLLGRDFPGAHIGPEPTTDRFIAVMHGQEDKTTPGNALAVSANMPFRGLEMFGNGFLSKFMGSHLDSPLLQVFFLSLTHPVSPYATLPMFPHIPPLNLFVLFSHSHTHFPHMSHFPFFPYISPDLSFCSST